MSRFTCECHDVEANVEKLQRLLAMESHLDEEMDELERLYQLDQLKLEWLMHEGYTELSDVIKKQMQKTESLLRLYSPMLQDTCAEKEAHIAHILTMPRHRWLITSWIQHQPNQQQQRENVQEEIHEMFPDWPFAENYEPLNFKRQLVLSECQTRCRHPQYLSPNTTFFMQQHETAKRDKKESSHFVGGEENNEIVLGFQQADLREMKKRIHRKLLHKSKGCRRKKILRCSFSGIQKDCNSSKKPLQYFKAKVVCARRLWAPRQFQNRHSFSKGIQRRKCHDDSKDIKLTLTGIAKEIPERTSSFGKLLESTNTTQVMEFGFSDQKMPNTTRITNSSATSLVCCNYASRTKEGNSPMPLHGNVPSIHTQHQKQKLPSQNHSPFLYKMPSDTIHKSKQYSKCENLLPPQKGNKQGTPNFNGTVNPNQETRHTSPSLNDTRSGSLHKFEVLIVTVSPDIAGDEQSPLNINDYISKNSLDWFDFTERDYVRE